MDQIFFPASKKTGIAFIFDEVYFSNQIYFMSTSETRKDTFKVGISDIYDEWNIELEYFMMEPQWMHA